MCSWSFNWLLLLLDGRASGTQLENGSNFTPALLPVASVVLCLRRLALAGVGHNNGADECNLWDGVLPMDPARDVGLLGPSTLPSFAYSHARPRDKQRVQDGWSPEHCKRMRDKGGQRETQPTFAFLLLHFSHACAVRRRGCSGVR
ncbi:hypothetical protein B0H19DRAFT_1159276 [Mycena capillaripes]|nr:hypothetical protein B0H19DRAFT_1159276 [Mycena capillaripes]